MYSGSGFSNWEIGDVDVFIDENGIHHLFHLIIPNHDYIAHAVSKDGLSWHRVKNALWVGDPGEWDDDMLWTMHISKMSESEGYELYYTGLKRQDKGGEQKIGRAYSSDLIHWTKENLFGSPLRSEAPHYESASNNPRKWISFRDPFKYHFDGDDYLLICARSASGPTNRRGCIGLAKKEKDGFTLLKPLHIPYVYDDVECPCVVEIKGIFYLIGSIREDVKVRYWSSTDFRGEYFAFHNNLLLPQGNYAARIVHDGSHFLVYNFYFAGGNVNTHRVIPPPKQLDVDESGRLLLKSYHHWERLHRKTIFQKEFPQPLPILRNPTASSSLGEKWVFGCRSGYEIFCFEKPSNDFVWEGKLAVEGMGKTGFVIECDTEGSGYFISIDFVNGYVQFRAWGFNEKDIKNNFVFENVQTNQYDIQEEKEIYFKIIRYGNYYELSINGVVKITLLDFKYNEGKIGVYICSAVVSVSESKIHILPEPKNEYASSDPDKHLKAYFKQ
ncbi:glycosyl hydrolase family 32 [Flavobacterium adhaerens]|uniref:glycosyl hydrolase family 32 n=1 Tax=Flavobacterium adhaerens TaxID=3149043 RepID=UPI0032B5376D